MLAVPLVGLLVLLGFLVTGEFEQYAAANDVTGVIRTSQVTQTLVDGLQRERALTVGVLSNLADDRPELETVRGEVDQARSALAGLLSGADYGRASSSSIAALAQLDDLTVQRAQVDAGRIDRLAAFQYFSDRIATLDHVDVGIEIDLPEPDPTLRRTLMAFLTLNYTKEALASQAAITLGAAATGRFVGDEFTQVVAARSARQITLTEFTRYATTSQRAAVEAAFSSPAAMEMARYEQLALGAADGRKLGFHEEAWWQAAMVVMADLRAAQRSLEEDIHQRTDEIRETTTWELLGLIPLAVLSVGVVIGLVLAASRSIVRPLGGLVAEANDIASRRLPAAVAMAQAGTPDEIPPTTGQPVPVRSGKHASREILSVAEAIDRMQFTAYSLAVEQARLRQNTVDSLANLGRRTQNLLRRQLNFISQLEREEGDPTALANLFELDHLATRLRRNAESLLVLVGETTPRRWSTPLPIADVIRAAVAEVEDYRRVSLRRIDEAFVGGGYVTDVAHLLAELVENGLSFSPPDLDVEIHGRPLGQGYLVAIVDHGIGMTSDDLARANARLRGEERFTVAPTRFLGHYVVGDLARDLGIEVQLVQSPVTGVTARVVLPRAVLAMPAEISA
ncbi:MAG: sensor histidine kinase, partial [Micromonosporaceae bacterium]|nr:sensor histidine kinase [Micromonosporaceae bacterium]